MKKNGEILLAAKRTSFQQISFVGSGRQIANSVNEYVIARKQRTLLGAVVSIPEGPEGYFQHSLLRTRFSNLDEEHFFFPIRGRRA